MLARSSEETPRHTRPDPGNESSCELTVLGGLRRAACRVDREEYEVDEGVRGGGFLPWANGRSLFFQPTQRNLLNLHAQLRQFLADHHPHLVQVKAEILMHQNVAKRDELSPPDRGVEVPEFPRQSPRRLSDDLQMMNYPNLEHLIVPEGILTGAGPLLDLRNGIEDIGQAV
jgi:hypothetical protein